MNLVKVSPPVVKVPDIITVSELNSLLTVKNLGSVTEEKAQFLIQQISGIIYKVTGQFFGNKKTMTLTFNHENIGITKEIFMPYRLLNLTQISINNQLMSLADFYSTEEKIVYSNGYFPYSLNDIVLQGEFGYEATEGIPNEITNAITILLEDLVFGDKYDRMQSNADSLTVGKLSVKKKASSYGDLSGNEEVDRILQPFIWKNSPIVMKNSKVRYSAL